jgi:hypothetical protein
MKLYFFRLSDYDSFKAAQQAQALRYIYLEDTAKLSLTEGEPRTVMDAIIEAVDLCAGGEPLQFVLTSDADVILDTF